MVLLLWGVMELRVAAPLVDLRTTARREVLLTNLASIMIGVSFFVVSLVLPSCSSCPPKPATASASRWWSPDCAWPRSA